MRRVDIGAGGPQPTASDRRHRGSGHAWRAMTLTPGEVEIYSSFMNNVRPETRKKLYAASNSLPAETDGRPRLQKYVSMQNQRQYSRSTALRAPPMGWLAGYEGNSKQEVNVTQATCATAYVAVQAAKTFARRSCSWTGLSQESQFQATRSVRKMMFSARRRAAGSSKVVPADTVDLPAAYRGWPRAASSGRKLGDLSILNKVPVEGVGMQRYRDSTEQRFAKERSAAAVAVTGAEEARPARSLAIAPEVRPTAYRAAATAAVVAASPAGSLLARATDNAVAEDFPSPPSNTPDPGDLDALSQRSEDIREPKPKSGDSGFVASRRIEVYMPVMAT